MGQKLRSSGCLADGRHLHSFDVDADRDVQLLAFTARLAPAHYVRDTTLAEDSSRIRKSPNIVARPRSFAY
jgi:hypothetical protein